MKLIPKDKLELINTSTVTLEELEDKKYWELLESHLILYEKYNNVLKNYVELVNSIPVLKYHLLDDDEQ